MHLLRPLASSDAAAPLAKPKPGDTGKVSAKGRADGAGNTMPARSTRAGASATAAAAAAIAHASAVPPPSSGTIG